MTKLATENDGVRAVARALDVLKAFSTRDFELSASELLERVDLSRPTLYRLLYTLIDSGFLVSVGDPQRFRLGPAVARLSHVWTATLDMAGIAEPVLRRLWRETQETVTMFVQHGAYRLCVAELPSPQALSFKRGVGHREQIILGASGRAMLAFSNPDPADLKAYASEAKVTLLLYLAELENVRKRGYAVSRNELIKGAISIAAPFYAAPGSVGGSIAVFGPSVRLDEPQILEFGKLVVSAGKDLTNLLCGAQEESLA
ncbi:IclR family transcriptional regulator [soil metagenome]